LDAVGQERKSQTVSRAGSQPSTKGPVEYFTGNVRVDPLFPANDSTRVSAGAVTFEPGARSAWHTHPAGQHLIVTSGVGLTQEWGGPVTELRAASPKSPMTHIAVTGSVDGKNVEWMEKVNDEQYGK
jgi:4-carboxymuconolactone decarboxylase